MLANQKHTATFQLYEKVSYNRISKDVCYTEIDYSIFKMKTHINCILPWIRKTSWIIFKTVENAKKSIIEMNEFKVTTYKMAYIFFQEIKKRQTKSAKEKYDLRKKYQSGNDMQQKHLG